LHHVCNNVYITIHTIRNSAVLPTCRALRFSVVRVAFGRVRQFTALAEREGPGGQLIEHKKSCELLRLNQSELKVGLAWTC
jgi:hypothetical protein